jgi:hypothetical protein
MKGQGPDKARRVSVTDPIAAARRYDYADAFELRLERPDRCSPEEWLRAGVDTAMSNRNAGCSRPSCATSDHCSRGRSGRSSGSSTGGRRGRSWRADSRTGIAAAMPSPNVPDSTASANPPVTLAPPRQSAHAHGCSSPPCATSRVTVRQPRARAVARDVASHVARRITCSTARTTSRRQCPKAETPRSELLRRCRKHASASRASACCQPSWHE